MKNKLGKPSNLVSSNSGGNGIEDETTALPDNEGEEFQIRQSLK